MTVAQLIEVLQTLDPNTPVLAEDLDLDSGEAVYYPANFGACSPASYPVATVKPYQDHYVLAEDPLYVGHGGDPVEAVVFRI